MLNSSKRATSRGPPRRPPPPRRSARAKRRPRASRAGPSGRPRPPPDGDGDHVAVPPPELLERRQQLVALGTALRATHALVGLAGRQLQRLRDLLGLGASVGAALPDPVEERASRARRVEDVVGVDGARDVEQRLAATPSVGVEQPRGAVEASGGHARDRGELVLLDSGRVLQQVGADRGLRQPAERNELAARADRLRQRPELVRDEDDHRVVRRLLEILEQRVRRGLVHVCASSTTYTRRDASNGRMWRSRRSARISSISTWSPTGSST